MRMLTTLAICAALTLGVAAVQSSHAEEQQASAAPDDGRDCFRAIHARRYQVIDDRSVRVRISPRRTYTLTTSENAPDLDTARGVAMSADTSWVCTGDVRGAVIEECGHFVPEEQPGMFNRMVMEFFGGR